MKSIYKISFIAGFALLVSCHSEKERNYEYMPNMYESVAYETYQEADAFRREHKEGQLPPDGTINRGFIPYDYANTTEGYNAAKASSKSPLDSLAYDEPKAQQLFTIYCAICHGDKGDGKGKLVEREKFLGVPNYKDRDINEGSVFHVETFGLNAMGPYRNQLNANERWLVARYVMKLRGQ
jgi:mono/diheme cytochrome c family protein